MVQNKNIKHQKCWLLAAAFFSLFILPATAQETSGWLASFNTFRLNKNFSLHLDAQLRSTDDLEQVRTVLLRPGLNFQLAKGLTATAGYAFISNRALTGSPLSRMVTEHRIWQQLAYTLSAKPVILLQRLRFEERFVPRVVISNTDVTVDGRREAFRLRYMARGIFPFKPVKKFEKGLFAALQNEVFLNVGDRSAVNRKTFDQNRLYGALGYRTSGKIDLEAGYMNQYTVNRTGFSNNHIVQLAVYKRL